MAITLYRSFAPLTKLPADWPDAVAGFLAGASNINLVAKTATSVAISGATQPRSIMAVDGLWRWSEGDVEAAVGAGPAATLDVIVWATANKFKAALSESEGEVDETNYSLHLEVRAHETLPAIAGEVAAAQKCGEVDWDGAKIIAIRQTVGHLRSTDPTEPTMPLPSVPAVIEKGIAAPTAPIRKTEAAAESNAVWEVLAGGLTKLKVLASGLVEGLSLPAETIPELWIKKLAIGTERLANACVTAAKLAAGAVGDAAIAEHRALVTTNNAYGAQVERSALGEEYLVSATQMAHVILGGVSALGGEHLVTVTVGTTPLPTFLVKEVAGGHPTAVCGFFCPPGVKWKAEGGSDVALVSSYLLL